MSYTPGTGGKARTENTEHVEGVDADRNHADFIKYKAHMHLFKWCKRTIRCALLAKGSKSALVEANDFW